MAKFQKRKRDMENASEDSESELDESVTSDEEEIKQIPVILKKPKLEFPEVPTATKPKLEVPEYNKTAPKASKKAAAKMNVENGHSTTDSSEAKAKTSKKTHEPKNEGFTWPSEDILHLICKLTVSIPEHDNMQYKSRIEKINWNSIKFKNYGSEECKLVWGKLQKQIRDYRLFGEVLEDARTWVTTHLAAFKLDEETEDFKEPTKPLEAKKRKKTPTSMSGQIQVETPRISSTELPKSKEETNPGESRKRKSESIAKPSKRRDRRPTKGQTPFALYFATKLQKLPAGGNRNDFKEAYKAKFKQLSDAKRVTWIKLAEQDELRYESELKSYLQRNPTVTVTSSRSSITKEEKSMLERASGKPVKPPNSAYNLYSSELLKSAEIKNVDHKERMHMVAVRWSELSADQKQAYKTKVSELTEQYKVNQANYIDTLPKEERALLLANEAKKKTPSKKKSVKKVVKEEQPQSSHEDKTAKDYEEEPSILKSGPQKPQITAEQYFASRNGYTSETEISEAWSRLAEVDRHYYKQKVKKVKLEYIEKLEAYLKSLPEEDLKEYARQKGHVVDESDNVVSSSDSCSSSEDSDGS